MKNKSLMLLSVLFLILNISVIGQSKKLANKNASLGNSEWAKVRNTDMPEDYINFYT